jgi:hypothetical protein
MERGGDMFAFTWLLNVNSGGATKAAIETKKRQATAMSSSIFFIMPENNSSTKTE